MTTLTGRPHTALLLVDVQNDVVGGAVARDAVVANIAALVDRARAAAAPVVWVQHSGDDLPIDSDGWQLVPELSPADGEPVVRKVHGDSFEDTDLETVLAGREVGRLIVAGAQSDACILSTLHGAVVRGYDALLVDDAHTTEDLSEWGGAPPDLVVAHTNLHWDNHSAPGREVGTVSTADVAFA